jgi:hypothetical protein
MKISLLSIKPNEKIPEILIYNPLRKGCYNMASAKTGSWLGCMDVLELEFKGEKALFIDSLYIDKRKKGYGSIFLDFAKKLSKKEHNGTVFLNANSLFLGASSAEPHAFYRKNDFTTDDKETLKKIDEAIKANRTLTFFDVPPTIMYWQEKNK